MKEREATPAQVKAFEARLTPTPTRTNRMTRKEKTRAKRTALIRALARKWLQELNRQMMAVEAMES